MKEWLFPLPWTGYEDFLLQIRDREGRAPDPKKPEKNYSLIKSGDIGVVTCFDKEAPKLIYEIKKANLYFASDLVSGIDRARESIRLMLKKEGFKKFEPYLNSVDEAIDSYLSFPNYKERISEHGIYSIQFGKLIKKV